MTIYSHPAFASHGKNNSQQLLQASRLIDQSSNAESLYLIGDPAAQTTATTTTTTTSANHSNFCIVVGKSRAVTAENSVASTLASTGGGGLLKSSSEPTLNELIESYRPNNSPRRPQNRVRLHPPGTLLNVRPHHLFTMPASPTTTALVPPQPPHQPHQRSTIPRVMLIRAKSTDHRSSIEFPHQHHHSLSPMTMMTSGAGGGSNSSNNNRLNYPTGVVPHAGYYSGPNMNNMDVQLDDQFVEEVVSNLRRLNQQSSLNQEDRVDPRLIPKVIKKSLIDLHKRSMWNLNHQQAHQAHLQKLHEQQQKQQPPQKQQLLQQQQQQTEASRSLFGRRKSLGRQNSSQKRSTENRTSSGETTMTSAISGGKMTASKSGSVGKEPQPLPSQPYQISANVVTQPKPRNEIKMKVVDNSYV
jgi:hypothetical protein